MLDLAVLAVMVTSALVPFVLCTAWMQRGKVGYAVSLGSVLGACFAVTLFAAYRWMGIDPIKAMSAAMIVFLPGTLGSAAGGLLGWLIYKRRFGGDG